MKIPNADLELHICLSGRFVIHSVRLVEDITEALWGTRVSPSAVSDLNQKLYERIEEWRNQPIEGRFTYIALDGIWLKRSWGGEVKNVAVLGASETLSYMAFPREHCVRIRTNNPLERIMREIRRRTRVVGAFPDGNSALMLVAARLRHIAGTKWSTRKHMGGESETK